MENDKYQVECSKEQKKKSDVLPILQELYPPGMYPWVDDQLAALPDLLPPNFDPWKWGHSSGHRQQFANLAGYKVAVDELLVPFLERVHQGESELITEMSCQSGLKQKAVISFTYEGFGRLC